MEPLWEETRDALFEIADYALKFHSDAVDIRFFNDHYRREGVKVRSVSFPIPDFSFNPSSTGY